MSQQQGTASQTETIRAAILAFDWGDHGLDEVGEADPEYADHLAGEIATALGIDEVVSATESDQPFTPTPDPDWYIAQQGADAAIHGMDEAGLR